MRDSGVVPTGAVTTGSIMRNVVWLVIVSLIGLGAVVAIKIGAAAPEGANVDGTKVGAATGQDGPIKSSSRQN
jgi:hypothetical protein